MGNSIHPKRTAGILSAIVGGEECTVRGEAEYLLSGWQNEGIPNANGTGSIGGKFALGYIKFTVANDNKTDHGWLKDLEGVDVQLQTGNGKIIVARDAWQADESVGNTDQGQFPIKFESDDVEEVK